MREMNRGMRVRIGIIVCLGRLLEEREAVDDLLVEMSGVCRQVRVVVVMAVVVEESRRHEDRRARVVTQASLVAVGIRVEGVVVAGDPVAGFPADRLEETMGQEGVVHVGRCRPDLLVLLVVMLSK